MKLNRYILPISTLLLGAMLYSGTRVAYTRPGLMMRIPTSSNKKTPYLFRAGVSTEFHNFNPFNTARGGYFETELGNEENIITGYPDHGSNNRNAP